MDCASLTFDFGLFVIWAWRPRAGRYWLGLSLALLWALRDTLSPESPTTILRSPRFHLIHQFSQSPENGKARLPSLIFSEVLSWSREATLSSWFFPWWAYLVSAAFFSCWGIQRASQDCVSFFLPQDFSSRSWWFWGTFAAAESARTFPFFPLKLCSETVAWSCALFTCWWCVWILLFFLNNCLFFLFVIGRARSTSFTVMALPENSNNDFLQFSYLSLTFDIANSFF